MKVCAFISFFVLLYCNVNASEVIEEDYYTYVNPASPNAGLMISVDGASYAIGDRAFPVEPCNIGNEDICIKFSGLIFTLPEKELDELNYIDEEVQVRLLAKTDQFISGRQVPVSVIQNVTQNMKVYFYYTPKLGIFNIMFSVKGEEALLLLASEKGYGHMRN